MQIYILYDKYDDEFEEYNFYRFFVAYKCVHLNTLNV